MKCFVLIIFLFGTTVWSQSLINSPDAGFWQPETWARATIAARWGRWDSLSYAHPGLRDAAHISDPRGEWALGGEIFTRLFDGMERVRIQRSGTPQVGRRTSFPNSAQGYDSIFYFNAQEGHFRHFRDAQGRDSLIKIFEQGAGNTMSYIFSHDNFRTDITLQDHYIDESVWVWSVYFNQDGLPVSSHQFYADDNSLMELDSAYYNERGQLVLYHSFEETWGTGEIVKEWSYGFTYNDEGFPLSRTCYTYENPRDSIAFTEWDSRGLPLEATEYRYEFYLQQWVPNNQRLSYQYTDNGDIEEIRYYHNDVLSDRYNYTYTDDGRPLVYNSWHLYPEEPEDWVAGSDSASFTYTAVQSSIRTVSTTHRLNSDFSVRIRGEQLVLSHGNVAQVKRMLLVSPLGRIVGTAYPDSDGNFVLNRAISGIAAGSYLAVVPELGVSYRINIGL